MTEEWRAVPGYEGMYEASSEGRVRSVDRVVKHPTAEALTIKGRVLAPCKMGHTAHLMVTFSRAGKTSKQLVHRVIAETFIPNPHNLPMVLHWDDDPTNNRVANLRWGTQAENMRDLLRNKGHHYGKRTHCKWGHEYTAENTEWVPTGSTGNRHRRCRECIRLRKLATRRGRAA